MIPAYSILKPAWVSLSFVMFTICARILSDPPNDVLSVNNPVTTVPVVVN